MANTRKLTDAERESAKAILENVRQQIATAATGDAPLLWAIRRYVYIRLQHDERGQPRAEEDPEAEEVGRAEG